MSFHLILLLVLWRSVGETFRGERRSVHTDIRTRCTVPICNKVVPICNKVVPICNKVVPICNKVVPICNKVVAFCNKSFHPFYKRSWAPHVITSVTVLKVQRFICSKHQRYVVKTTTNVVISLYKRFIRPQMLSYRSINVLYDDKCSHMAL